MVTVATTKIGRRIADAFKRHIIVLRVYVWVGVAAATIPYIYLRGIADNLGMPREQVALRLDRVIGFGELPTLRLQGWLYHGHAQAFDWVLGAVHTSWFVVPEALTLYVIIFRWDLFAQLAAVRLGVLYLGLIGFFLLPTEPPWMAASVVRILEVANGEPLRVDNNAVAALPSLHVALPAALMMWLWVKGLRRWALPFTFLTALMILAVVYLGEHYVVDAIAGVALAFVVTWLVVRFVPSIRNSTIGGDPRTATGAARVPPDPYKSPRRLLP